MPPKAERVTTMNSTPFSDTDPDAECKACGAEAMVVERACSRGSQRGEIEQTLWRCTLCGDTWTSAKHDLIGGTVISYYHIPAWTPILGRTAEPVMDPDTSGVHEADWDYFIGDEPAEEDAWREELARRRRALKARIAN